MDHETNPFQENLERSARASALLLFSAPPVTTSLLGALAAGLLAGVVLGAAPVDLAAGLAIVTAPAVVAAYVTTPAARALGGTLYLRRAALLAAGSSTAALGGVVVAVLAGLVIDVPPATVLFLALGFQLTARQAVLSVISDHRHVQTFLVALIQPVATLPALAWRFGTDGAVWGTGFLLWIVVLVPFTLVMSLFDAPLSRNFGVSASQVFRHYLDHVTTGSGAAEDLIERLGEPVEAPVAVLAFRRADASAKACLVVPSVHPGPFGALGGGDLPAKIAEAMRDWPVVLVPHGAANHDFNPVSTKEVERLAAVAAQLAAGVETSAGGSALMEAGGAVRVAAQAFGRDVLLTYTSWPEAIDDVEYGVGLAAELEARVAGFRHAVFADCHNSLKPGAGAVFPCQPRALEIQVRANEAATAARGAVGGDVRVGVAQDRETFTTRHLIGRQGCQALVVEAGGKRTAYVLWDGNNMLPEATAVIRKAVLEVVDACQVMTTDNHSVNVAGAFSPVGAGGVAHQALADVARRTVERAVADLEPVTSGVARGHVPGLRVFGHHKTAQMASAVNTMTSITPELIIVCLGLWVMGISLVFLAL